MRRGCVAILVLAGCFIDNPEWLGLTDGEAGSASASASGSDTASETGESPPATFDCDPLPAPPDDAIVLSAADAGALQQRFAEAPRGSTVLLADGDYLIEATAPIVITTPELTVRSMSGEPSAVQFFGGTTAASLFVIEAADVQIAEVTFTGGLDNSIFIDPSQGDRASIYRVLFIDPGIETIETGPTADGVQWAEDGRVECSTFRRSALLTDPVACGRDAALVVRGGRNWLIRANVFQRYGCASANAGALEVRDGARDSMVVHNRFVDCNRAVLIGNQIADGSTAERRWPDVTCVGTGPWGHYGGLVANNVAWVGTPQTTGDTMFSFWAACDARIYHNTALIVGEGYFGIEYRWPTTNVKVFNNATTHEIRSRDGGTAEVMANVELAPLTDFADGLGGDLHLAPGAAAIGVGLQNLDREVGVDIDGQPRDAQPDAGADEFVPTW